MKQWNIESIKLAILSVSECKIESIGLSEDYATEQITVSVDGSNFRLYVRGFRTDHVLLSKDHNNVELVEVTTGYSDGDMPNDPNYVIVHARVKAAIMTLGYSVVNSMDQYF